MKRLLPAVLSLVTFLPVPALAGPSMRVIPPTKTKNACLRKVTRLSSAQKFEDALAELSKPACTENLGDEEQLWVDLMQGVLHHGLAQGKEAEDAFCRALKQEPLASLPLAKPSAELDGLFEKLRVDCPERDKPKPEQAAAPVAPAPVVAEVAPPPPPVEAPPPAPVVEEPLASSSFGGGFELHAGLHGDADFQRARPVPLYGVSAQGSVHLFHGLRGGLGLTAAACNRFTSGPIFMAMLDARLAYPLIAPVAGRFGLHAYATGGPVLYLLDSGSAGGRAGLGLSLDVSQIRVSVSGGYEWRSHYRLGYGSPMATMELGWKLF